MCYPCRHFGHSLSLFLWSSMKKYKNYGVREYWIVDPKRRMVTVNYFEGDLLNIQYFFESTIKVNIYDDLYINFSNIADILNI